MTAKAIEVLKKNPDGYFLFVEGAKIDLGHHEAQARYALDEAAEFSDAIEYARKVTSEDDTIILVTADHAHTMSISGYPVSNPDRSVSKEISEHIFHDELWIFTFSQARGNDIFGTTGKLADDGKQMFTLSYANGLGYHNHVKETGGRVDLTTLKNINSRDFRFPGTVPMGYETHGGDDVAVYVSGPYSHLFRGTFEQNYIPHALAYAACIGHGKTACDKDKN